MLSSAYQSKTALLTFQWRQETNLKTQSTKLKESISPPKDSAPKFQLGVKQNKLRSQVKTRSVDDQLEQRNARQEMKQAIKRSTSDKFHIFGNSLKSPTNGEFNLANQNAAFGLKPTCQVEITGNYGYDRKMPFHNIIMEEKDECYSSNQHSLSMATKMCPTIVRICKRYFSNLKTSS